MDEVLNTFEPGFRKSCKGVKSHGISGRKNKAKGRR